MATRLANAKDLSFAAVLETVEGVAEDPTSADRIAVTGPSNITQTRGTTDSEERSNTLDVLYQFLDAKGPGSWSANFYTRTAGTPVTADQVTAPQGDAILQAIFGKVLSASGIQLAAAIDAVQTTISYDSLVGELPDRGFIKIEDELIYFDSITRTTAASGTFNLCTRGAAGTTAAAHVDDTSIKIWSRTYQLTTTPPSLTIYDSTDFFNRMLIGATPNTATFEVSNTGGAMVSVSGEGQLMKLMGEHSLSAGILAGATSYVADYVKRVEADFRIWNKTKKDDNGGLGYKITDVDAVTGAVTLSSGILVDWDSGDLLAGFLPALTPLNVPLEGRNTALRVDGQTYKITNTSLSMSLPKDYINNIINQDYPEFRTNGTRSITMNMTLYLTTDMVDLFRDSFEGKEAEFEVTFGVGIGNQFVLTCSRGKFSTPTISEDGNTVTMAISVTMLGTTGEDSISARCE